MKVIVQKFGGTSIASPGARKEVIKRIVEAKQNGFFPVVVVSALRYEGCPYSTDALLSLLKEVVVNPREKDLLLSCGEIIASVIVALNLEKIGHPARALTGAQASIITDNNFGEAKILEINPTILWQCVNSGIIPVVAGFQGVTYTGEITTLGRGGSDITAVALGYVMKSEKIEFYKEVPGIMTTDPKDYKDAKLLPQITYEELGEMSISGANVLHPVAVSLAQGFNLPVFVKGTFSPYISGTSVMSGNIPVKFTKPVTAITKISSLTTVSISLENRKVGDIFKAVANAGISMDFISYYPKGLMFVVGKEATPKIKEVLSKENVNFSLIEHCVKVTAVGAGMRGRVGVMARAYEALERAGVEVIYATDSHITLAFLIPEKFLNQAITALHKEFIDKA